MAAPSAENAATLARALAARVVDTRPEDLPPLALERASMSIASTIASAAMGTRIESTRIVRDLALDRGGKPEATVWFSGGHRLPATDAARCNAVASDAAASDDSDLRNIAHIGTIATSTALALAERNGKHGRDVLHAMVLGYEVAGRIDEALTPGRGERGFHSAISTIFSGAVVAGTLLGLDRERMTHAIALAATSIGGLHASANSSTAREYHAGLSALLGIHAAQSAQKGFRAEPGIMEMSKGFFAAYGGDHLDDVLGGWGTSWDIVTDMAVKLVPGGHPHHAVAEAAANAAIEGDVKPEQVASILVSAPKYRTMPGPKHPIDLIGMAHSPSYFIAAAVADRHFGWVHATSEKIGDPVIAALIDRIVTDPDPKPYPDRFPHHHGATVTITLLDGRSFSSHVDFPRGAGPRGILWTDIEDKYRTLVPLSGISLARVRASFDLLRGFGGLGRVTDLTALIA